MLRVSSLTNETGAFFPSYCLWSTDATSAKDKLAITLAIGVAIVVVVVVAAAAACVRSRWCFAYALAFEYKLLSVCLSKPTLCGPCSSSYRCFCWGIGMMMHAVQLLFLILFLLL